MLLATCLVDAGCQDFPQLFLLELLIWRHSLVGVDRSITTVGASMMLPRLFMRTSLHVGPDKPETRAPSRAPWPTRGSAAARSKPRRPVLFRGGLRRPLEVACPARLELPVQGRARPCRARSRRSLALPAPKSAPSRVTDQSAAQPAPRGWFRRRRRAGRSGSRRRSRALAVGKPEVEAHDLAGNDSGLRAASAGCTRKLSVVRVSLTAVFRLKTHHQSSLSRAIVSSPRTARTRTARQSIVYRRCRS